MQPQGTRQAHRTPEGFQERVLTEQGQGDHRVSLLEPSLEDRARKGLGETSTLYVRVAPVMTVALGREEGPGQAPA